MKKVLLSIITFVALALAGLFLLLVLFFESTKVRVENIASEPVHVTALWRDKKEALGELRTGSIVVFEVSDEASMSFLISYKDGRAVTTTGVYFTSGVNLYLLIEDRSTNVSVGT